VTKLKQKANLNKLQRMLVLISNLDPKQVK